MDGRGRVDRQRAMANMFERCSSLTNLDLSSFDTSKVEDMYFMFGSCSSLNNLDISNFKTQLVEDMSHMFDGCKNVQSLNLKGLILLK